MATAAATIGLGVALLPASAGAQAVKVGLGDTLSAETLAFVIGLERAKERGVAYNLTSFSKEELAIQATINGQADIGVGTPYAVMQKTKAPLRAVFQMSRLVFFPVADKSYRTWKDLDGQPFVFHGRGSGTEAIGDIIAKRNNIKFGQRSYVPGSENRVIAMINGQIKATIVDLANKNLLMSRAPDRFHVLPSVDVPASDELVFVRADWLQANRAKVDIIVEEMLKLWQEMAKDPTIIDAERKKRNLMADLPKQVLDNITPFYQQAIKEGVYDRRGGGPEAAKVDFEFYVEAGQMQGPLESIKAEDYWDFGPLDAARKKLGS
ncbi:MAG: ABC transporter substrate-binding protein [Alphaproteobacteria bacterium]|nr:ABC transporter substrate-binding protein [Alphaproteobacteria bacterium]